MKVKVKTIIKRIACITAVFMLSLFTVFESAYKMRVYAEESSVTESSAESSADSSSEEESKYTNVLEDLQKDESFNVEEYPVDTAVDKMEVIQIAESSDKELFVYVYQPNTDFNYLATEIRMGFPVVNQETEYRDYDLTLLSRDGVFSKYLAEEVTVSEDVVRYYDIVQLARPYESVNNTDNTINTFVYDVSQKWTAVTLNGITSYSMTTLDVIVIEDKYVGFIRYEDNYNLFGRSCDSHFVAFSSDYKIEKLVGARVGYIKSSAKGEYNANGFGWIEEDGLNVLQTYRTTYGTPEEIEKELEASNKILFESGGIFQYTYEWNEIQSTSTFLSSEEDMILTENGSMGLENTEWVLRFELTDYSMEGALNLGVFTEDYTSISEVTIFELTYEVNGKTYTVGCVDNKQTGSENPSGEVSPTPTIDDAINKILKALEDFFNGVVNIFTLIVYGFIFGFVIWAISKLIGWFISLLKSIFKRR